MYSIGCRYCGGCNPQIDRARVISSLKENLKKRGAAADFTAGRKSMVDLFLLINGCPHACLEEAYLKEGHTTPFISVRGEMVDRQYVREDHIPDLLIHEIADLLDPAPHRAGV
jgi:hypothetical protein